MGILIDGEMLPWTATTLEREMADFLSPDQVDPVLVRHVRDSFTCPEHMLASLAWDWSVDRWFPGWQESIKRQVIDSSLDLHREKGTLSAVERVLDEIGASYTITLNPNGEHHTMQIDIGNQEDILDESQGQLGLESLITYIDDAKRLTVHHNLNLRDQSGGAGLEFGAAFDVVVVIPEVTCEVLI